MRAITEIPARVIRVMFVLVSIAGCDWESADIDNSSENEISSYAIVDTGQAACYDNDGEEITYPEAFYGQDAQFDGNQPSFTDKGDGTVTDVATGLMWEQADSGEAMDWEAALAYAEIATTAGHNDWHLPNIKELQSIVDYTRSPDTTGSAAINPMFDTTSITSEAGAVDYLCYWSSYHPRQLDRLPRLLWRLRRLWPGDGL